MWMYRKLKTLPNQDKSMNDPLENDENTSPQNKERNPEKGDPLKE